MELLKEVDKRKKVEADLITERDYWHKKTEQTTFDLKVAQQRLEKVEKKENKISTYESKFYFQHCIQHWPFFAPTYTWCCRLSS